jgi:hypothetical protein
MHSTENEISAADIEAGYERNDIQLKGIMYFGVGLLVLIVITFGLMWALYGVLEGEFAERHASRNPMQLSDRDRLPPEPRLQGAPGFSVQSQNGPVNLELTVPQAEYWELKKQWDDLIKNGVKHPETGTVIAMPIEEAKAKVLEQDLKSSVQPGTENLGVESRRYYTEASSGRVAGEIRR